MRFATLYTVCPLLVTARLFADNAYLDSDGDDSAVVLLEASPASTPHSEGPVETSRPNRPVLELRQVPEAVAPAVKRVAARSSSADPNTYAHEAIDPALPAPGVAFPAAYGAGIASSVSTTATTPASALTLTSIHDPAAAAPIKHAVADGETVTSTPPTLNATGDDYISVQWVETWIGGSSRTWVPQTFTVHFPDRTPGPSPGKGQIGMGSIKGEAGHTKTIVVAAAPTQAAAAALAKGVAAAAGLGILGLVVW